MIYFKDLPIGAVFRDLAGRTFKKTSTRTGLCMTRQTRWYFRQYCDCIVIGQ